MNSTGIPVWDLATRLFHWLLAVLVALSWYSGKSGEMELHIWSGLTILTLVLFRLIWGLIGSSTARFAGFVKGPGAALRYLRDLRHGHSPQYLGHNPLGGWMVLALLAVLALQTGTGLFANDDIFTEGPLAHLVSKQTSDSLTVVHKTCVNILLGLVALHIAAALFYLLFKRENLIHPMITGIKRFNDSSAQKAPRLRHPLLAAAVLAVAAAVVWTVATQF